METGINYEFKDSDTQDVSKTLLIAVAGPTGAGKTESAMRIARGIVGPGTFAVIDSENKRALNKKSRYRFQHLDFQPPYSPENFHGAIEAAIKAGHRAIIVDSFSAEWDGEGGLHDEAIDALERMSKGDVEKAERLTALAWKHPKQDHKRLMNYLRKCEVPIIFALRAEPKIKFIKDDKGKTQVVDAGWLPITEKLFGYDMLIYALMMAENPGVPVHLKKLEPEFEAMFPVGKQIDEECGERLAQWAAGGQAIHPISDEVRALIIKKGQEHEQRTKEFLGKELYSEPSHQDADLEIIKADFERDLKQANGFKEAVAVRDKALSSNLPTSWKDGFKLRFQEKFRQAI